MSVHVFLLVFLLIFSLAPLCVLCWPHPGLVQSRAEASVHTTLHRLRHRRALPTIAPSVDMPPLPRWVQDQYLLQYAAFREVKSRRGAPKRIDTQGFACPNQQCQYSGITDAQIHAAFRRWQAWPCRADPDVPVSVLLHHLQCST
jgi:hypothetical protein